jgi:hypothetical protein
MILRVLSAGGLQVSPEIRRRVLSCADTSQLETHASGSRDWSTTSSTCTSQAEEEMMPRIRISPVAMLASSRARPDGGQRGRIRAKRWQAAHKPDMHAIWGRRLASVVAQPVLGTGFRQ